MPGYEAKVEAIRTHFAPLIGAQVVRYRTAEIFHQDGDWGSWPDLPIRIYTDRALVSVSWSRFDDLWLSNDESLPFVAEDATTRWVENDIPGISGCIGRSIHRVSLGRGDMSVKQRQIEIWTRLLIDLGNCWLEVFNALDENGYILHRASPSGEFVHCI